MREFVDVVAEVGLVGIPFEHEIATLDEGGIYGIGAGGHHDPGRVLSDLELVNNGEVDVYFTAIGGPDGLINGPQRRLLPAGEKRYVAGVVNLLLVMTPSDAAGPATAIDINGTKLPLKNDGAVGGHPGDSGVRLFVFTGASDEAGDEALTWTPRRNVNIASAAYLCLSMRVSAAGDYELAGAVGEDDVFAAPLDLEDLTEGELTDIPLDDVENGIDVDAGSNVVLTASAPEHDVSTETAGDLLVVLVYTLR